ncbi:MAG: DUF4387 domain-containing protein [Spirochaetaceae bacterium]|jgi:hypothetical protein|nr:DUF4387 domain-containing protein [Spirochaetaceae bacterium]
MERLGDLAKVLRSKNSGPFLITLDVLFDDPEQYRRVVQSGVITPESVSAAYGLALGDIREFVFFEAALGIKITYNRAVSSGTSGDRDVYGAQQHAPLMEFLIPGERGSA